MMAKSCYKKALERMHRENAKDEATALVLERWEEFCDKADVAMLYALRNFEPNRKMGVERLYRFYRFMLEAQYDMIERFRSKNPDGSMDDGNYWVMQDELEKIGVDFGEIKRISDEVEAKAEIRMRKGKV